MGTYPLECRDGKAATEKEMGTAVTMLAQEKWHPYRVTPLRPILVTGQPLPFYLFTSLLNCCGFYSAIRHVPTIFCLVVIMWLAGVLIMFSGAS